MTKINWTIRDDIYNIFSIKFNQIYIVTIIVVEWLLSVFFYKKDQKSQKGYGIKSSWNNSYLIFESTENQFEFKIDIWKKPHNN